MDRSGGVGVPESLSNLIKYDDSGAEGQRFSNGSRCSSSKSVHKVGTHPDVMIGGIRDIAKWRGSILYYTILCLMIQEY